MSEALNYRYTFKIGTFDAGPMRKMRLSSILKYQEYAGECHLSEEYNLDYETVREKGVIFVLVNATAKIHRMPRLGETVTIDTWNKQLKGLKFFRGYDWFDENGDKIIEGVSAFVLVDKTNHKLAKPDKLRVVLPEDSARTTSVSNPSKIHLPAELSPIGSKKVLYSMLDSNEHLNNALYADFLIDFTPENKVNEIKEFAIDFVKEAKFGEKVEVYSAVENNSIFIKGCVNDNSCFRGKINY